MMMDKPIQVRIATLDDRDALMWHCYELFKDNYMGLPYSPSKVAQTVDPCCKGTGGIAGIIDGEDGAPIGSIGIVATQPNYSDVWILSEAWTFVTPEFRKGSHYGKALFDFARWYREHMASEFKYDIPLEMTVYSFNRLEAKTRFWRRFGTQIGSTFWIGGRKGEVPELRKVN